jgi:branched-chain amino acid transport system permease protein
MSEFIDFCLFGISLGSIYAIVAIGFTIIYSVTRIINFAQGEFVMLGAMISFQLFSAASLPLPLAFVLSIASVAIVGLLLERLAIHPARNAPVVSLIIITIGASIFIRGLVGWQWGKNAVVVPTFSGEEPISVLGAALNPQSFWIFGTAIGIMVLLQLFFSYTMLGKALRACAVNRRAATLMGINPRLMSLISFSLAATLGAVGGIVTAPLTAPSYDVGVMLGVKGFIAAAIGGFSSQVFAVLGGIGLGVAESLGAGYLSSAYKDAFAIGILFIVLLIRVRRFREGQEEEE